MENIIVVSPKGLFFKGKKYACALGEAGIVEDKEEGDKGCFPIRFVLYRRDRVDLPNIPLEKRVISEDDGWCDEVGDINYNRMVKLPYSGSTESLWREDHLYDIVVVLGYNDNLPVPGKGSAVFMHIAREEYTPTAGCIALSKEDLLEILNKCDSETKVCVKPAF